MRNYFFHHLSLGFRLVLGLIMLACIYLALTLPYSGNINITKQGETFWKAQLASHPYLKNDLNQQLAEQHYGQAIKAANSGQEHLIEEFLYQARKYSQETTLTHKINAWIAYRHISQWLNPNYLNDKIIYQVTSGDSLGKIASTHNTTLRNLYYLNNMSNFNLYAGSKLVIKPLNYNIVVNLKESSLSLYDEDKFLCSFPVEIIRERTHLKTKRAYKIGQFLAQKDSNNYNLQQQGYLESYKRFRIKSIQLDISDSRFKNSQTKIDGIYLNPLDMEDLSLLLREGNTITFI